MLVHVRINLTGKDRLLHKFVCDCIIMCPPSISTEKTSLVHVQDSAMMASYFGISRSLLAAITVTLFSLAGELTVILYLSVRCGCS